MSDKMSGLMMFTTIAWMGGIGAVVSEKKHKKNGAVAGIAIGTTLIALINKPFLCDSQRVSMIRSDLIGAGVGTILATATGAVLGSAVSEQSVTGIVAGAAIAGGLAMGALTPNCPYDVPSETQTLSGWEMYP